MADCLRGPSNMCYVSSPTSHQILYDVHYDKRDVFSLRKNKEVPNLNQRPDKHAELKPIYMLNSDIRVEIIRKKGQWKGKGSERKRKRRSREVKE